MSESATDMAKRLGMSAPQLMKQLRRIKERMLTRHDLAAQLFLGADGKPTAAALKWLRHVAGENYVNRGTYHQDPREHAYREGRRELALEIIGSARLDVDKLNSLTAIEREME